MITLTKTINKLPKNPLLKTNKVVNRFEMNIKTITGNHQQASPQAPYFLHFLGEGGRRAGVCSGVSCSWDSAFRSLPGAALRSALGCKNVAAARGASAVQSFKRRKTKGKTCWFSRAACGGSV